MQGNVWEWCEDVWDEAFYSKTEATGIDPVCRSGSDLRVRRGGSYMSHAAGCRSTFRASLVPVRGQNRDVNFNIGFRPVWPLP